MSKISNALLAGVFTASMIFAPAAFAQTAPEPTGKTKIESDTTARQPENSGAGTPSMTGTSEASPSMAAPEPTGKTKTDSDTSARQPENNGAGTPTPQ